MYLTKLNFNKTIFNTLFFAFFLSPSLIEAQTFKEKTEDYIVHYKEKFKANKNAPVKEENFKYMRFYEPDSTYSVECAFERTPDAVEFQMPTYSGLFRAYIKYGILTFKLKDSTLHLSVYRNLTLKDNPTYKGYLFVPYKDLTNAKETYGGGRYLEMWETDIQNNKVVLDFNKSYNPYCAYSDGYNCPVPPSENHLKIKIEAGEKIFEKQH
jgi:uncharacterized protein